tara:strand:- start:226 stop:483 length:258 start_codon:yes stop_codon:yes gene_type:complete
MARLELYLTYTELVWLTELELKLVLVLVWLFVLLYIEGEVRRKSNSSLFYSLFLEIKKEQTLSDPFFTFFYLDFNTVFIDYSLSI